MTMQALTETAVMIAGELKRRTAERWGIAARIGWLREEKSRTKRGEAARLRPWGKTEPSPETQIAIERIQARLAKARDVQ
jgi:hypothetical protein